MNHRNDPIAGAKVLVTGASSGIGRALSLRLAAAGARLAVTARRLHLLAELAAEIEAAGLPGPAVLATDLSVPGRAAELGSRAIEALGGIDILVNNAGTNVTGPLTGLGDGQQARAVFETNVWAPLALARATVPEMRAAGGGLLVNVTSTIQAVPLPLLGYYAASKAALALATRSLRLELADTPVRVLEVIPGGTDTALRDVGELPWRADPPRMIPPVPADAVANAIVRAIRRGTRRVVYPPYSLLPIELPVVGRAVARAATTRVDTAGALERQ
jgi:uncharacterized protein